ncbi:GDP-Man:Man(1)GlcNAc(2)-PP-dolichol alpha-1,3-mannosyltransferase [Aspergillus undulatus]|uniref:GDP-Man:Man(1)GlcNAc(2)-PP-dolichol alpha-1,3-mannosyltransferase n=1 Tax=Aspergillus undulatus TaxID=1810928 RepID=UPI003CCCBA0C
MSEKRPEPSRNLPHITIIHPDLGIGGAERLIIDVALALQNTGHKVSVYTSHCDKSHCFEEARDGTLDVNVRGDRYLPPNLGGRFVVLFAILRQVVLTGQLLREFAARGSDGEEDVDEVFIVDQVPACVPILKVFGDWALGRGKGKSRQRILFYCHFPDQLLARRDEGGLTLLAGLKGLYRYPFDAFEGWAISAADRVVANSQFTRGVVQSVFGGGRLGDVKVVYPCVDTEVEGQDRERENKVKEGKVWAGKKILLSVNRFERKKDLALAIRAYHGLGEGRRGVRLVVAGGYDPRITENVQYHAELETLTSSLGLQHATSKTVPSALSIPDSIDVLFLPSVSSAFRDTLLSQSSLLLYTPVNEHFGIVPIEAMRAGIPVLASNTGGPLETILEGETGWLRDATDVPAWTAVMDKVLYQLSEAERKKISVAAKERVERLFSLRAMGETLESEIGDMLGKERRAFSGGQQVLTMLLGLLGLVLGAVLVGVLYK